MSIQEALDHIALRDKMDRERLVEPLIKPQGAIELDSTVQSSDELLQKCLNFIKESLKNDRDI
jgi:cytidylate kinase